MKDCDILWSGVSSWNFGQEILFIGDDVHIQIQSIEPISDRQFSVKVKLDDSVIVGHITEYDDEIHAFNFDEEFFDVLFAFNGLGFNFNRDYFSFRNGDCKQFPWDYGIHDQEILEHAIKVTKTPLDSLMP